MQYPVRARIVDVVGKQIGGIALNTPDVSEPHIDKEGLAEKIDGRVRITLDDGTILWGYECWWTPIEGK